MGYGLKDCMKIVDSIKELPEHDLPFSLALKAELSFLGKVNLKLRIASKRLTSQGTNLGVDAKTEVVLEGPNDRT